MKTTIRHSEPKGLFQKVVSVLEQGLIMKMLPQPKLPHCYCDTPVTELEGKTPGG